MVGVACSRQRCRAHITVSCSHHGGCAHTTMAWPRHNYSDDEKMKPRDVLIVSWSRHRFVAVPPFCWSRHRDVTTTRPPFSHQVGGCVLLLRLVVVFCCCGWLLRVVVAVGCCGWLLGWLCACQRPSKHACFFPLDPQQTRRLSNFSINTVEIVSAARRIFDGRIFVIRWF